jgi:hypothetical protein
VALNQQTNYEFFYEKGNVNNHHLETGLLVPKEISRVKWVEFVSLLLTGCCT